MKKLTKSRERHLPVPSAVLITVIFIGAASLISKSNLTDVTKAMLLAIDLAIFIYLTTRLHRKSSRLGNFDEEEE